MESALLEQQPQDLAPDEVWDEAAERAALERAKAKFVREPLDPVEDLERAIAHRVAAYICIGGKSPEEASAIVEAEARRVGIPATLKVFAPTRSAAAPKIRPRSREPRRRNEATRRARARSPGDKSESEPPRRRCCGCPLDFTPSTPQQRYHSEACASAARQRRFKKRRRKAVEADAILDRYRDEVFKARSKSLLTAEEAIELLIEPSERVLGLLAKAAA